MKPVDYGFASLEQLADRAHKLVREFTQLPMTDRERAAELLAELEVVTAQFRRLRPPPLFSKRRTPVAEQVSGVPEITTFRNRALGKIIV